MTKNKKRKNIFWILIGGIIFLAIFIFINFLSSKKMDKPAEMKNNPIRIVNDSTLELSKETTFAQLGEFVKDSKNQSFYQEALLYDLGDSGDWKYIEEFEKLMKEKSNKTIYSFYTERKLYDPNYKEADKDLDIFFHIRFVK